MSSITEMKELTASAYPGKTVSVVRLQMVREARSLYGLGGFTNPERIADMVKPLFEMADREMLVVISMNAKQEPVAAEVAAIGGISECCVDVRNVFKHALISNASFVVCVHNHPSGDPAPSGSDIELTERLKQAGLLLGIPLIDHIILADGGYYSFHRARVLRDGMSTWEGCAG